MVSDRPLDGLRVVDLTRFVSGSYATFMLAALGAEVVKIEVPPDGDPYRGQGVSSVGHESALFLSLNSGKLSVAVDFRAPEVRGFLDRLLHASQFFVENARPGSLARHGLDFPSVHERHPHLIYGSISAYGDVGPYADRGGFDLIVQAESGVMSVTGSEECGPAKVGAPFLDVGAGLACVVGLLAAYVETRRSGIGCHVRSSLLEFALAGLSTLAAEYLVSGKVPGLLGSHSPTFAPYGAFRARDDYLVLAGAGSEHLWVDLCRQLGLDDLVDDARFVTNAERVKHRDELTKLIEDVLASRDASAWVSLLEENGIPAGMVCSLPEVLESPQTEAVGILQTLHHASVGSYRTVGVPARLGSDGIPLTGPAPVLGAHTRSLLSSMGVPEDEIADLVYRGLAVVA
jgi:crotonobetainyl-CoA:carnitine CoA-transferase CaiB-like acyl-CoA transferase